jgi:hypothetical protein
LRFCPHLARLRRLAEREHIVRDDRQREPPFAVFVVGRPAKLAAGATPSNLIRIAWTRLQKIFLCEVASFQAVYRTRRARPPFHASELLRTSRKLGFRRAEVCGLGEAWGKQKSEIRGAIGHLTSVVAFSVQPHAAGVIKSKPRKSHCFSLANRYLRLLELFYTFRLAGPIWACKEQHHAFSNCRKRAAISRHRGRVWNRRGARRFSKPNAATRASAGCRVDLCNLRSCTVSSRLPMRPRVGKLPTRSRFFSWASFRS